MAFQFFKRGYWDNYERIQFFEQMTNRSIELCNCISFDTLMRVLKKHNNQQILITFLAIYHLEFT